MDEKLNRDNQDQPKLQIVPETPENLGSQNQEESSEEEKQQLEAAKVGFENLFNDATAEQRRDKLVSAFKPFFDAGLIDEKVILPQIEACCSAENKDVFI